MNIFVNLIKNRLFLASLCFIAGLLSMFGLQKLVSNPTPPKRPSVASLNPLFDHFFDDDFFGRSKDPFEEMRRMRQRMLKHSDQEEDGSIFDSWYGKRFGGSFNEITQREDDHFLYYDLAIEGLKQEQVKVTVTDGQISISGQIEKKSNEGDGSSYFSSSFHRSFPAPTHVEVDQLQIEQLKDKISIKFPKKKAASH